VQETIPVKVSNRKAREVRLHRFDGLAAFANMGDSPEDWAKFRRMWPEFFPAYLTGWIFRTATQWWRFANPGPTPPDDWEELRQKWPGLFKSEIQDWEWNARAVSETLGVMRPPLLFYRDLLRQVWSRDDPSGNCLRFLLGFESQAVYGGVGINLFKSETTPEAPPDWNGSAFQGQFLGQQKSAWSDLPSGFPVVNGIAGAITWEFGCQFQRAIYDLMQERWRAMGCPKCCRYFIADKTAQNIVQPNVTPTRSGNSRWQITTAGEESRGRKQESIGAGQRGENGSEHLQTRENLLV